MPTEDEYAREVVRSVEAMSRQLVEFRQDIARAMYPLYPRIVEIEKRLDDEAKERPDRQKQLDKKLAQQDAVLKGQDEKLDQIFRRQFWGRVIEAGLILLGMAIAYWILK